MAVSLAQFNPYQQRSLSMLRRAEEALGADPYAEMTGKIEGLYGGTNPTTQLGGGLYSYGRGMFDPAFARATASSADMGQQLANRASVDTAMAFEKSKAMKERELGRMGINPNSGRFAGLVSRENLARAAAESGNMTRARAAGAAQAYERNADLARMASAPISQGVGLMQAGLAQDEARRNTLANLYASSKNDDFEKLMRLHTAYGTQAQESETANAYEKDKAQKALDERLGQMQAKGASMQAENAARLKELSAGVMARNAMVPNYRSTGLSSMYGLR